VVCAAAIVAACACPRPPTIADSGFRPIPPVTFAVSHDAQPAWCQSGDELPFDDRARTLAARVQQAWKLRLVAGDWRSTTFEDLHHRGPTSLVSSPPFDPHVARLKPMNRIEDVESLAKERDAQSARRSRVESVRRHDLLVRRGARRHHRVLRRHDDGLGAIESRW
jgi:hypothetical protein